MPHNTLAPFITLGAAPIGSFSFISAGEPWARIDSDGHLTFFDEDLCRIASAQPGAPGAYARLVVLVLEQERANRV